MAHSSDDLGERLLNYGVAIINILPELPKTNVGKRVTDKLLRTGTAVGANYEEAQAAESRADFTHKLQVSLKELRKSCYWLHIILRARLLPAAQIENLLDEAMQLRAILSKATARAKRQMENQKAKDKRRK